MHYNKTNKNGTALVDAGREGRQGKGPDAAKKFFNFYFKIVYYS